MASHQECPAPTLSVDEPRRMSPHLDDASDRAFRPSFFFRQRYGKLDWKVIAHVQLEQIIADVDVKQLQHVLDPLAFSEVRPEDLPLFAPELVCKAFQLLQLLLEYSLNYAHNQQDLIHALREQNKDGKLHHNQLQNELRNVEEGNVALRRDLHRYHSFVHLCKRLLAAKSVDCDEALDELWLRAEADGGMLLLPYEHNLPRPPVSAHLCDRCHKAFCSPEFLRRHRQRRHGITPEDDEKGIVAPTPKAPAVDVAMLEEKIRGAVSQEMASVVQALREELHKTREELGQRATAADAYKDLLERHKASLAEKEIELGKVKAERDWLQKELEKVRRGVPAMAVSQPTLDKADLQLTKHKSAPATILERLQPVVRHKSKLQVEGEKRKKARQLLKAYKCVYRDLRCAWYRWIAKTSARASLVQSTRSASRSALLSLERIQALRERYGIATKTAKLDMPSTPPPPPSQPVLHSPSPPRLNLEEYLRDFERRVESMVRQQLGNAPVLKRGEEYDRQAVQEARQAVLAQLETNAHLLGVDVSQSFLRSLQLQEALSEQQPEQPLDPAATSLKNYLGSVLGALEDGVDDIDGSAIEELQQVLHSYMEAVDDPSNQTVRFPADAVLTWLTEVQQHQTHQGEATSAEGVDAESLTPSPAHSLPWSPDHASKQHVEETVHSISVDPRSMMSSGQESVADLKPSLPLMSTPPAPEQRQELPAAGEPRRAREEAASPHEPVLQVGPLQVQAPPPADSFEPNPAGLSPESPAAASRPSTPDMVSEGFGVDDGWTPAVHDYGATEGGGVTTPVTSPGPDAAQDFTFTETVVPVDAPDAVETTGRQPAVLEEHHGDIVLLQSTPVPPPKPPRPASAQPPDSPSQSTDAVFEGPPRKPARTKDEKAPSVHENNDGSRGIEQSPTTPAPPEDQTTVAVEEPSLQEVNEASAHNMAIQQQVEYLEVHGEHGMISPTSVRSFTPPPDSPPSNARVGVQHQSRAEDSQEDADLQVIEL